MQKVKTGNWKSKSDTAVNSDAKISLDAMETSGKFLKIAETLTEARDAYNVFSKTLTESRSRAIEAISVKNAARLVADNSMEKLAMAVNGLALGDIAILLASRFELVKQKGSTPPVTLEKPLGVKAVNCQNSGDVKLSVAEAVGAESFMYQYTLDPVTENSVWESEGSKRKSFTFLGLTSGTKVWFRVVSIGSFEQQMVSDCVSCIVI